VLQSDIFPKVQQSFWHLPAFQSANRRHFFGNETPVFDFLQKWVKKGSKNGKKWQKWPFLGLKITFFGISKAFSAAANSKNAKKRSKNPFFSIFPGQVPGLAKK
jgi:hypothetical protein